jgi:hypothetical protein
VSKELKGKCPFCEYDMTHVTGVDHDQAPKPGDLTMCIRCGAWCVFTDELALRKPTTEELADIAAMPVARRAEAAHALVTSPLSVKRRH